MDRGTQSTKNTFIQERVKAILFYYGETFVCGGTLN